MVLILHDIRSVHNVGAIFRTAEAAGVSKIYLSGITPGPLDRFLRERADFKKAALGAERLVPWERAEDAAALLGTLKKEKYQLVAVEQSPRAVDYKKVKIMRRTALLFGNEVKGVPKALLEECDVIAEIPMRGRLARNRRSDDVGKESLNVSVAAGIALFRILNL